MYNCDVPWPDKKVTVYYITCKRKLDIILTTTYISPCRYRSFFRCYSTVKIIHGENAFSRQLLSLISEEKLLFHIDSSPLLHVTIISSG